MPISQRNDCGSDVDDVERSRRGIRRHGICKGRDSGSGTVLGVGLVAVVGALIGIVGLTGQVMYSKALAQTGAQIAAIGAAGVLNGVTAGSSACSVAGQAAVHNAASVVSCSTENSDAQVEVSVATGVPLLARVHAVARAGPKGCS